MRTVNFFGHQVSKLIVGDNPFTGHSYIEHIVSCEEMLAFYTAEKIKETLFELEACGYNTILPLADPYIVRLLREYERDGGKLKYIFQSYMPMDQSVSNYQIKQLKNTIGIYLQGTRVDNFYEEGRPEEVFNIIDKFRMRLGADVPVGIGTHRPDVIALAEEEKWNVDFYMASMQNARRNREGEPSGFFSGKTKEGLIFYPEDRPIMLEQLKSVEKPILAYKIFAGGQIFLDKTEEQVRETIKGVYEEVFSALKPDDMAVIGVFQRDKNQARENAEIFNQWDSERNGK